MNKLVPALAIAAIVIGPSIGTAAQGRHAVSAMDAPTVTPETAPVPVWRDTLPVSEPAHGTATPASAERNAIVIERRGFRVTPVLSTEPVEIPADRRAVRTVGPTFLPSAEHEIDLRAISAGYNEPVNAVFAGIVGYLRAPGIVTTANAEPAPTAHDRSSLVAAID